MATRPSARLDSYSALNTATEKRPLPPRILATVGKHTGPLLGVDGIRIDAAMGSLRAMSRLRARYLRPALLDLPGAGTGPVCSPLTTSELLVYASAERFDWVSLRGVTNGDSTRRARAQLHPSIRLAATISVPAVLEDSLPEICDAADALILNRSDLARAAGWARGHALVQQACEHVALRGLPCMIIGELLSSAPGEAEPIQQDVDSLSSMLAAGASHLILDAETRRSMRSQAAVDALRLAVNAAETRRGESNAIVGCARLAGNPTLTGSALTR